MLKQVKFTVTGCNTLIGNFSSGDMARVDSALAAHLVDEAKVAIYVQTAPKAEADESAPKRGRKQK